MVVAAPVGLKELLNTEIMAMVEGGIWTELDKLVFKNLHTEQASTLDIKGYKDDAHVGSPTWTAKVGITIDTNKYVDTQYNANDDGVKYTVGSAGLLVCFTGVYIAGFVFSGAQASVGLNHFSILEGNQSSYNRFDSTDGAGNFPLASADGLKIISRTVSNKVKTIEGVSAEVERDCEYLALFDVDYKLGTWNGTSNFGIGYVFRQVGFFSGMDPTKRTLLRTIINDFNSKIATAY